jgi:phosphoglycerate dehydrogenase-like enzyme
MSEGSDPSVTPGSVSRPLILVLPQGALYRELFPPQVHNALSAFAEVVDDPEGHGGWPRGKLHAALREVDGVITGWGSPRMDVEALDAAPRLKIVGHAAGTIKSIGSPALFEGGIPVLSAHAAIAPYVGEMALALTLAGLRQLPRHDRAIRNERTWGDRAILPETLIGKRVGLVGLGATGRAFLKLLAPFGGTLSASDPHVTSEAAEALGVRLLPLDELLSTSDVVSLHAASLPETYHLLGRKELGLLPDGALLVNTARGQLIDPEALIEALESGQIRAALDVTEPEPLPPDHPFRVLPNVLVSPHISGPVPERRWEMAALIVEEMRRFFSGEPLRHAAPPVMLQMD